MSTFHFERGLVPADRRPLEVVERKGIGHPDTLADGVAEVISLTYAEYCQREFGAILHHNIDKIAILGGRANARPGFCEMVEPHRLILNGRMSTEFGERTIDWQSIQKEAATTFLRSALPRLDTSRWLDIHVYTSSSSRSPYWFHPRTRDDVPDVTTPWASDTSAFVGYWPLSTAERLALGLEGYFYREGMPRYDAVGQDIKVMAVRHENTIAVTMCVPFFADAIPTDAAYFEHLERVQTGLEEYARQVTLDRFRVELHVNTLDRRKDDIRGRYLVCTGSSIDFGEEGVVGRGNRSRGVVSSLRPSSMEAICGKNPVYHVGKVYAYIADVLAQEIATRFNCECEVVIVTRNGDPLRAPHHLFVHASEDLSEGEVREEIERHLASRQWTQEIIMLKPFLPIPGGEHSVRLWSD